MLPSHPCAAAVAGLLCAACALGSAQVGQPARAALPSVTTPAAADVAPAVAPLHRPVPATASRSHHRAAPARRHRHRVGPAQRVRRVLRLARHLRGRPYRWGAAGPHAFDCSGFVQYVYRHALGRHLPKYTDTQYRVLRHIHRHALRRGDLVFVGYRHHHKSHVGIYAGHGKWWEAPHTGSHVRKRHVWGRAHSYARVIRR